MKRIVSALFLLLLYAGTCRGQQNPELKFIAETLVVEADGTYQADPDLATLTFDISAQDKELRTTYDRASQAMTKIVALADKNGVPKSDVVNGVLTVRPFYEGDRKKRAKSYSVQGQVTLKIRDFSKIGPILEGSVDDGITDFRSLAYSLADEEAAKQRAVAEAMKRAMGRASAALEQKGQKVGALRFVNLDVKQLVGMSEMGVSTMAEYNSSFGLSTSDIAGHRTDKDKNLAPPPPVPQPEKITVSATVQCAFQIQ